MKKKLETKDLTGPQKAAVFLLSMGESFTAEVFRKLNENEIKKAATVMADIDQISPEVQTAVMEEFVAGFGGNDILLIEGETFIRKVIDKSLDSDKARAVLKEIESRKKEEPFTWSWNVDVTRLKEHIEGEHPQTIAMILAHLPPEIASDILVSMPENQKGDIALRIAQLGQVPEEIVREVDLALQSDLSKLSGAGTEAGGLQTLVDILNGVDKATEELIMETIEEEQTEMATDIRKMMFIFEDLIHVDDRGMREILKKVESQQLVIAMKTASEEMKQKIFGNLSSRAAEMLKEDLEVMGPVRLTEVEQAQQEIVRAAKELEAEGTIVLGGKGKEDILV